MFLCVQLWTLAFAEGKMVDVLNCAPLCKYFVAEVKGDNRRFICVFVKNCMCVFFLLVLLCFLHVLPLVVAVTALETWYMRRVRINLCC